MEDRTNTIKEMAIAMETGNRSQYGKIKIISTRKQQTDLETF